MLVILHGSAVSLYKNCKDDEFEGPGLPPFTSDYIPLDTGVAFHTTPATTTEQEN